MALILNAGLFQPLTLVTIRFLGVVDSTTRTYEIMKADQVSVYRELRYKLVHQSGGTFVQATIRFQFGDVRLTCPREVPLQQGWAMANSARDLSIDSRGCLMVTKDELRLVTFADNQ